MSWGDGLPTLDVLLFDDSLRCAGSVMTRGLIHTMRCQKLEPWDASLAFIAKWWSLSSHEQTIGLKPTITQNSNLKTILSINRMWSVGHNLSCQIHVLISTFCLVLQLGFMPGGFAAKHCQLRTFGSLHQYNS